MIYTDKQYAVSNSELAKLRAALVVADARQSDQAWLRKAEIDALSSQIEDIESEMTEYDLLKSGQLSFSKAYALEELPRVLVQARIASGMSQTDLAERLNMKPQQVQRYEATEYMGASLARLIEVSRALNVKASGAFESPKHVGGSVFAWGDADDIAWSQLPIKEMVKRKWFQIPKGGNPIGAVRDYFLGTAGPQFATALHRKKMRGGNMPNEYALLAWQARVLDRAREVAAKLNLADFEQDDSWIPSLVELTRFKDGVARTRDLLASKGIILIVERHLPGSYLDGAAMLAGDGRPVVGLTLRHDRLDNFWFTLMHELGHVFLHLFDSLRFDFFDEENGSDSDHIELEADRFALDALIPAVQWDQCLSRFALSEEAVRIDAANLGIDPAIVAGRIRKERGNYTILSGLVGSGEVRSQLEEVSDDLG